MKKVLVAAACAAVPLFAFAQSANTITFQGEVSDQTCSIDINGNAANSTVLLSPVSTGELASQGATAGLTTFEIGLNNCTAPETTAQSINTVFVGNKLTPTGNLGNSGTATNVSLQVLDPTKPSAPFNLATAGGYRAPGMKLGVGQTSAKYSFAVQYYAEKAGVTPGSVVGSLQYAVSYE